MKKRLFIAIEVPQRIKEKIADLEHHFEPRFDKALWTKPENIHLTLVFLGNTDYNQIPDIITTLDNIKNDSFEVVFSAIGGFPNLRRPHTLWIGIQENLALFYLREKIIKNLSELNLNIDEKKFIPHLTITRFRKRRPIELRMENNFGKFKAKEFILFDSVLSKDGPKHQIIKKFQLR